MSRHSLCRSSCCLEVLVDAWVIQPLVRGDGSPAEGLARPVARSAAGACDRHEPRKAKRHAGAPLRFAGLKTGHAHLTVRLPKGPSIA